MTEQFTTHAFDLVLDRYIDAPRAAVYRCLTEADLMVTWFTPAPWKTKSVDVDVRVGGRSNFVMQSPEGDEFPNAGIYLEVSPGEKIVTTDAYTAGWVPAEKPFMTAIITLADEGNGTRYRAVARHWNEDDMKAHEEMGFHAGWNAAADQLEAVAKALAA